MVRNDFSAESIVNYEQKCLCVLVLDISDSMGGTPIEELNRGLVEFYDEIARDESINRKFEVSLITFNRMVKTVIEPSLVENFTFPQITASGSAAAMVDAVKEAIDKVEARKAWYKQTGQNYYRPYIILIANGKPDDDQDVDALAQRIKTDMANNKYIFIPIGGKGANMAILDKIAGEMNGKKMGPLKLKGANFKLFFQWLNDMETVVKTEEVETVNLGIDTSWMAPFVL
jgi:uncharacterized protein YegL